MHKLLCVFLVWPTKFANTLSFYAKQFWCLKILILGKLGLKLCFWKTLHHILMHFVHQFQCFEVVLPCVFILFKNCVFSQKLCEPLSASIDPICFSINRICFKIFKEAFVCFDQSKLIFNQLKLIFDQSKLVNQVFKISEFDVSNLLFKKVFKLFLSLRIGQG